MREVAPLLRAEDIGSSTRAVESSRFLPHALPTLEHILVRGLVVEFFVPGIPRSTQTGTTVRAGGRAFPIRRNPGWSAACGLVARQHAPPRLLTGPLKVRMHFVVPMPKRLRARYLRPGRAPVDVPYPITRPDIGGNAEKGLLDSWNGVLFRDDAQIVDFASTKVYETLHARPGVHVRVEEL